MEKDLNLALKKDVFEGLKNGTTTEIVIEKTNWWKKRLMDLDTGRFKEFTNVVATCGDSGKYNYKIENIVLKDDTFVVSVSIPEPEENKEEVVNEELQPENVTETIDVPSENLEEEVETESEQITEQVENQLKETFGEENVGNVSGEFSDGDKTLTIEASVKIQNENEVELQIADPEENHFEEDRQDEEKEDVREQVNQIFSNFCKFDNVYLVNTPNVTIRYNGQILGCTKRLIADRDSDVKFNFNKKEFIKYDNTSNVDFIAEIISFMKSLLKTNCIFLNRNLCGFRTTQSGNLMFYMTYVSKKKYLFSKA